MVLDTGGVMEPLDFAPSDAQELISVIVKTISGLGLSSVSSDTFVSLCFAKVTLSCLGLWDSSLHVSFLPSMGGGVGGLFDFGRWNRSLGHVFALGLMGRVKSKSNSSSISSKLISDESSFVILMSGMTGFEFRLACLYWEASERDLLLERSDKGSNSFFTTGMLCFSSMFSCSEFPLSPTSLNESSISQPTTHI